MQGKTITESQFYPGVSDQHTQRHGVSLHRNGYLIIRKRVLSSGHALSMS